MFEKLRQKLTRVPSTGCQHRILPSFFELLKHLQAQVGDKPLLYHPPPSPHLLPLPPKRAVPAVISALRPHGSLAQVGDLSEPPAYGSVLSCLSDDLLWPSLKLPGCLRSQMSRTLTCSHCWTHKQCKCCISSLLTQAKAGNSLPASSCRCANAHLISCSIACLGYVPLVFLMLSKLANPVKASHAYIRSCKHALCRLLMKALPSVMPHLAV